MKRVMIAGYLGFGNCGDEAMLAGAVVWLRGRWPGVAITVLSADPARTRREHPGVAARPNLPPGRALALRVLRRPGRLGTLGALRRADAVYWLAGSGLFSDVRGPVLPGLWPALCWTRRLARRLAFVSVSAGPLTDPESRGLTRRLVAAADAVCPRDAAAAAVLEAVAGGAGRFVPLPDLALWLRPAPEAEVTALMTEAGLAPEGNYLGICIPWFFATEREAPRAAEYREQFLDALAGTLDAVAAGQGLMPVLIPFQSGWDERMARALAGRLHCAHAVLGGVPSPARMLGLLGRMRLVLAMRLHSAILAAAAGTPMVGIVYDGKVRDWLAEIGMEDWTVEYPVWARERAPLDGAALAAKIEAALAGEPALRAAIAGRVAVLRRQGESATAELARYGL